MSPKNANVCEKMRVWSHLLEKLLKENFIFCAVLGIYLVRSCIVSSLVYLRGFDFLNLSSELTHLILNWPARDTLNTILSVRLLISKRKRLQWYEVLQCNSQVLLRRYLNWYNHWFCKMKKPILYLFSYCIMLINIYCDILPPLKWDPQHLAL